jgi:ubiquinone biosynthesis monooxygenase Coq7
MTKSTYDYLPGDRTKQQQLKQLIRVNHAGEYAARLIYQGQIDALKDDPETLATLLHMQEQEQEHLDVFEGMMREHRARPTALQPFWHVASYALGRLPAMVSKEAAMAVTVAVEEVIEEHYNEQLEELDDVEDKALKSVITKIRDEEVEHRDIGLENDAEKARAYPLLYRAVKNGCKVAIQVAKRV